MQSLQVFNNGAWNVRTCVYDGAPHFCGHDVAKALGFANPRKAFQDHVFEEDRVRLQDIQGSPPVTLARNEGQAVYLREPGVYALVFGSTKAEAITFKRWVCSEVLPRLRKCYQEQMRAPLCLRNEADLHYKVVQAIRRFYPHALMVAGLGELQNTPERRLDAYRKGYQAGQADLLILNHHKSFNGLAIELKNPKGSGKLSGRQAESLENYRQAGFQTIVSDDYDNILLTVFEYMQNVRICCNMCGRKFKTNETLTRHCAKFHRTCAESE